MSRSPGKLRVGFVIDGRLPGWSRPWEMLLGSPSGSAVGEMRYGWIARALNADPIKRADYSLFRPWQRYDAVVFLKSMGAEHQRLARLLRERGTRVLFDVNVDYFSEATGTFYYRGMAPSPEQIADARRMAECSDALIADSSHLARICAAHHPRVRWISDNVEPRIVPAYRSWKPGAKLDLLWSGEAVKLFELLCIEGSLRRFASRLRLTLVTNDLSAMDRWFPPHKERFEKLLADLDCEIIPFRNLPELLRVYARGGIFISPRFLDNSYNWGHTEWKITLPMACGRMAFATPLPSYRDVAERSGGAGLRFCENDEKWGEAFESALAGDLELEPQERAARSVVREFYSTPVVAAAHHEFLTDVVNSGN